jgi:hypothetical protein
MSDIPYAKLGVSQRLEPQLSPDAPRKVRLAIARGVVPLPPAEQLGALYALAVGEDEEVRKSAIATVRGMPVDRVLQTVSIKTHPKILEFLAEFREPEVDLDERIGMMRTCNDRTLLMIARRAGPDLCETMSRNHERLLVTPDLFVALHANPKCADRHLQGAESFLRMQRSMPEVPEKRPFEQDEPAAPEAAPAAPAGDAPTGSDSAFAPMGGGDAGGMDLMAEIEAALRGEQSPALLRQQEENLKMFDLDALDDGPGIDESLGGFSFDFADDDDEFTWNLTADLSGKGDSEKVELKRGLEAQVRDMAVGQKIKLAYKGNKEVRAILIRDTNKVVAGAVVKSGRLSDREVASFAANKNLDGEVIREIAMNREFTRRYPVKVALANNPKTPVSLAVSLVGAMQKKDLMALARNRNIPSVVTEAANRLVRKKYRK